MKLNWLTILLALLAIVMVCAAALLPGMIGAAKDGSITDVVTAQAQQYTFAQVITQAEKLRLLSQYLNQACQTAEVSISQEAWEQKYRAQTKAFFDTVAPIIGEESDSFRATSIKELRLSDIDNPRAMTMLYRFELASDALKEELILICDDAGKVIYFECSGNIMADYVKAEEVAGKYALYMGFAGDGDTGKSTENVLVFTYEGKYDVEIRISQEDYAKATLLCTIK